MYAIYVRVSTEDQATKGYSLGDQLHSCKAIVPKDDPYKEYIDDGVSGEILDRPALNKLREDTREGIIDKVICYDPDRWSRKLLNQLLVTDELEKNGVEIIFVNSKYEKTPEGQLFYSMRGAISEFEKAKIKERTSRGRRQKAREGKVLRDFQIYGYDYDHDKQNFVLNEQESTVVREIYDLFTGNSSIHVRGINGIAINLTERGIPTKRNAGVWHRQVVRQILLNEAYTGKFYSNRWDTDGMGINKFLPAEQRRKMKERPREEWILIKIPPIITDEQYKQAQSLLERGRRLWAGQQGYKYLLSGLVRCECGNTMTGRNAKNWGTYSREYTCVKNFSGAKSRGCGNKVSAEKIDNEVWEQVKRWLYEPEEVGKNLETADNTDYVTKDIERVEKELQKTRDGRKKLFSLLVDTDMSTDDAKEQLTMLQGKEDRLNKELIKLQEKLEQEWNDEFSKKRTSAIIEEYLNKDIDLLTIEEKQILIRKLVERVLIGKDKQVHLYTT